MKNKQRTLRRGLLEKLEDRNLMAADWNPAFVGNMGYFVTAAAKAETIAYVQQRAGGALAGTGAGESDVGEIGAEGFSSGFQTVNEVENNDGFNNAQPLPLGTIQGVDVVGNNTGIFDEDWYSFTLDAGDILDFKVVASIVSNPLISLYNASNQEIASGLSNAVVLPASSPLTGTNLLGTKVVSLNDRASLHYVAPTTARYYIRIGDVLGAYTASLRLYRAPLEQASAGTKQILFIDFDGGIIQRSLFGLGPGSSRMSPMNNFLQQLNLQPADESALISQVMARLQSKFDNLAQNTTNRNFGIELRNSRDHADPWGNANVSRVVVGGTWQELVNNPAAPSTGILGIAESVDLGNFDTTETAIVMLDTLIATYRGLIVNGATPQLNAVAELMAVVIAHEAGHFFGGYHQDPSNLIFPIMDQFYAPTITGGAGRDGIFGTADDLPMVFGVDRFAATPPFLVGGINDTVNIIGYGLSSGQVGGRINGNVFVDRNLSRTKDSGDTNLPGARVYVDLNGNDQYDGNESSAISDSLGNYSILVPAGSYTVRQVVPPGYRLTTPVSGEINVTVVGTNTVSNVNFGQEQLNLNATGVKWNDVNGNGLRDTGEGIITGVRLYLDLDGDKRIDIGEPSARTNDQGQYTLTFPGPGTYKIREVVDPGYVQTFPNAAMDFEHTVVVTGNPAVDAVNVAGLNFGNKLTVDFGDAPATYGGGGGGGGDSSAGFTTGLRLGANWDDEQASQYSATAAGDDAAGPLDINDVVIDDEDGVVFTRPLVRGSSSNRVAVSAVNSTGASAYFSAWVDFNLDGDFNDAGEKVISDSIVGSGTSTLTFAAPASAVLGTTFARFRYSNQLNVGPTGRALGGEVEDYQVRIVPTLDLATNDRFTVSRNSVQNSLDVLANDFALPGEALEIVTTSGSSAGGIIQVSPTNQILYTPPAGFIGQDTFEYTMRNTAGETDTATVVVDVNLFFENPIAVDDSFDVTLNAIDVPLAVLANDIEGRSGALTIIMVTSASAGGQVSIATGGKSLRYTPVRGFNGTETLTYTVADASGNQTTARVTIQIVPRVNASTDVVYRLRTTDLNGNEISAIPQGQDFKLEVLVDDFRNDRGAPSTTPGVFAAYMDLLYNLQLVTTSIPDAGATLNFDVDFDPRTWL